MFLTNVFPSSFSCSPDGLCFALRQISTHYIVAFIRAYEIIVPFVCDHCVIVRTTRTGCEVAAMQLNKLWMVDVRRDRCHTFKPVSDVANVTDMSASAFRSVMLRIGKAYSAVVINIACGEIVFRTLWRPKAMSISSWQHLYEDKLLVSALSCSSLEVNYIF